MSAHILIDVGMPDDKGRRLVIARYNGGEHRDTLCTNSARSRKHFLAELAAKIGAAPDDLKHLDGEIIDAADAADAATIEFRDDDREESGRKTQATQLVELAADDELFHDSDGVAYVSLVINDCQQTWPLKAAQFKSHLQRRFYEATGKAAGSQAVQDALGILDGKARYDGEERVVAVRVGGSVDEIWLDLADDQWRVVHVTKDGWQVMPSTNCPIRFLRRPGMKPLPVPIHGGDINELRPLVNLPDEAAWVLFVAFLVWALHPAGPFPVLVVNGEQGSAKTTLCRIVRELLDANKAPLRRPPKDERDLMVAACNSWLVAYNNLSGMPVWLSDAICALAHDGGFGTRALYTDADEKIFDARRPVLLNGIDDFATRPDLMDRAIVLTLPQIPDERRCEEASLLTRLNDIKPAVLGAILTAVATAIRNRPSVTLGCKPRMADFAVAAVAAEEAFGWPPGTFMRAYTANRQDANATILETSAVAKAVNDFVASVGTWEGSSTELLKELVTRADEQTTRQPDWPKSPAALGNALRRLAPNLRRAGVDIEFHRTARRKVISLGKPAPPAVMPVTTVTTSGTPLAFAGQAVTVAGQADDGLPLEGDEWGDAGNALDNGETPAR